MKKQCVTFGLGVVVGVVVMTCIFIMRESFYQKDVDAVMVSSQITVNYDIMKSQESESILLEDENEDTLISQEAQIRSYERIICDYAIESYMSGEWDGTEKELPDGHIIKLREDGGYLLLDGYIGDTQTNLDIPESAYDLIFDDNNICDYAYVPGEGTYTIIDSKLVKFLRGKQVELPGNKLSWKGFKSREDMNANTNDDESYIMYELPTLIYNKIDGKLYLTTGDKSCTLDNSIAYLYVFDDYNKSEMRYIGKVDFEYENPRDIDMSKVKFVKK